MAVKESQRYSSFSFSFEIIKSGACTSSRVCLLLCLGDCLFLPSVETLLTRVAVQAFKGQWTPLEISVIYLQGNFSFRALHYDLEWLEWCTLNLVLSLSLLWVSELRNTKGTAGTVE